MNEMLNNTETVDVEQLQEDIRSLREFALTSNERNNLWIDETHKWDLEFKKKLIKKFGSKRFAQQVPVWQVFSGGSVEPEIDITDEARSYIVGEVNKIFIRLKREIESI